MSVFRKLFGVLLATLLLGGALKVGGDLGNDPVIEGSLKPEKVHREAAEEIVERLIYPMISEGAKILDEGIAQRPGDIDVAWVNGYGFPVWRGGPMFYADQIGLKTVRDRLNHYVETSGNQALRPAPLLDRLANEGADFASYGKSKERAA